MLNSCGRISDPNLGGALLQKVEPTTDDIQLLINLNNKRKQLTNEQFRIASKIIQQQSLERDSLLVVQGDFHKGITGILASKISSHYKSPQLYLPKMEWAPLEAETEVSSPSFRLYNLVVNY